MYYLIDGLLLGCILNIGGCAIDMVGLLARIKVDAGLLCKAKRYIEAEDNGETK